MNANYSNYIWVRACYILKELEAKQNAYERSFVKEFSTKINFYELGLDSLTKPVQHGQRGGILSATGLQFLRTVSTELAV